MRQLPSSRANAERAASRRLSPKERFVATVEILVRTLGVALPKQALANVHVLAANDRPSLATLAACGLPLPQARLARHQLQAGHSSFWPQAGLVLLAGPAKSHLAEEAAHFLRHAYAPVRLPRCNRDAFYLHTVEEALAFYASKLICPSRRPVSWQALWGHRKHSRSARAIATSALAHLAQVRGEKVAGSLFPSDPSVSDAVSHLLGYRLGQALFVAARAGACDKRKIGALFTRRTSGEHQALLLYWQLTLALRHYLRPVRPPQALRDGPAKARATA